MASCLLPVRAGNGADVAVGAKATTSWEQWVWDINESTRGRWFPKSGCRFENDLSLVSSSSAERSEPWCSLSCLVLGASEAGEQHAQRPTGHRATRAGKAWTDRTGNGRGLDGDWTGTRCGQKATPTGVEGATGDLGGLEEECKER